MNISNMKNMIVLKNLPSNLIDEAIVILKANKKIKKGMYLGEQKNKRENMDEDTEEFIVREAEMIVSDYISDIEMDEIDFNMKLAKKNKKLRLISCILGVVCWVEFVALLI